MGWSGRAPAPAGKRSWSRGAKFKEHDSFHVVGLDQRGAIVLRQRWSRGQVETRLANKPPCLIGMEACVGAHHLSRKLKGSGHEARDMIEATHYTASAYTDGSRLLRCCNTSSSASTSALIMSMSNRLTRCGTSARSATHLSGIITR